MSGEVSHLFPSEGKSGFASSPYLPQCINVCFVLADLDTFVITTSLYIESGDTYV